MMGTTSRLEINKRSVFLALILVVGLFLRLYNLGGESLWLDEAASVTFAHLGLFRIFFLHDTSPPLYYIILHWWIQLFGSSEVSLRVPSVIFGFLSILMLYGLGKKLFDADTGVLGALLMAFSVFHIQYSQEARTYSLTVLLTLLSMYYFIRLLERTDSKTSLGYILFSVLLIYSHVYGLFIIIAQNIYFLYLSLFSRTTVKRHVMEWFSTQFLVVLLFMPWVRLFLHEVAHVQKGFWIESPHISEIISSFRAYSSGSTLLLWMFLILSLSSLLWFEKVWDSRDGRSFPASLKSYKWRFRSSDSDKICLLLIWLTAPIIVPLIISKFSQPIYTVKYTIVASSAFFLLVASGISKVHSRTIRSITISLIIALSLIHAWPYYSKIHKEQWREVAEYVDRNARTGDMVLFNAFYCMIPFDYYSHNGSMVKEGFPEKDIKVDEKNIGRLREIVKNHDRIWLILSHSGDKKELIRKTLMKSYSLLHHKDYKYIKLYLFDKVSTHTSSTLSDLKPDRQDHSGNAGKNGNHFLARYCVFQNGT